MSSPYKRKGWTNSGGPLVNSVVLWGSLFIVFAAGTDQSWAKYYHEYLCPSFRFCEKVLGFLALQIFVPKDEEINSPGSEKLIFATSIMFALAKIQTSLLEIEHNFWAGVPNRLIGTNLKCFQNTLYFYCESVYGYFVRIEKQKARYLRRYVGTVLYTVQ